MALLVFLALILAMTGHSAANWCICRSDVSDSALQKTLDYACGAGADCTPILQNGACYQPNTVKAHCSYAVNSYFQRKNQGQGTCDFSGTSMVTTTDPSTANGCVYPPSPSSAGTITTPTGTTPSSTTTTTTPSTTTPSSTLTPTTGVIGGIGSGLGPSGINTDTSGAVALIKNFSLVLAIWFSGLLFLWA